MLTKLQVDAIKSEWQEAKGRTVARSMWAARHADALIEAAKLAAMAVDCPTEFRKLLNRLEILERAQRINRGTGA